MASRFSSKITVLMPVYNAGPYLKGAIENLLTQTFPKFELLVINDGSTDDSVKIIKSFPDHRIRLVNHRKNKGIAFRLNEGLRLAQGKYIARADADDLYHPQRLEKQLRFLKKKQLDLVGTWAKLIDKQGKTFSYDRRPNNRYFILWSLLFGSSPLLHPSVMFDKKLVLAAGGYDPRWQHVEDYDLWSRLAHQARIGIVEEDLISLRIHEQSISRVNTMKQGINTIKISQRNIEQFLGKRIGRKGFYLLKGWCQGEIYFHRHEIMEAFAFFQSVYDHFLVTYKLPGSTLYLINHDYAQKLLRLLNVNQVFDKRLIWKLTGLDASLFKPVLIQAYLKNPKLILSPGLNLFLGKFLVNDLLFLFKNRSLDPLEYQVRKRWRKILYRLHRLSQELGFSSWWQKFSR